MSLETALRALPFMILLLQGLMGWFLWSLSQRFVTRDACGECHAEQALRMAAMERFIAVAEVRSASQVTQHDLEKIYGRMNKISSSVDEQAGEMKAARRTLDMINQHLMRGDK